MSISLCMIVKDEEAFLENSILSAKGYVNDIVVTDTGSKDKTKEIALKNGARLFDFEWCNDFSAARNFTASYALNDWIFILDADEIVKDFDEKRITEFIKEPFNLGSVFKLNLPDNKSAYETRLYNRKNYKYRGVIHEQIVPIIEKTHQKNIREIPIFLEHYGYSPQIMASKKKLERNEALLLQELEKHPDDPYIYYQLGKRYFFMSNDLVKSCDYFEKALEQLPNIYLEYVYSLVESYGYALINSSQYKKALIHVNNYSKYYNIKPNFRFLKAHVYLNNGMFNEALECFKSCIVNDVMDYTGITSFLSYYNMGIIFECLELKNDAKLMYEHCGGYEPATKRLADMK